MSTPISVTFLDTQERRFIYRDAVKLALHSLLFSGPVVWNCLDKMKNARKCENIDTFKRVLKTPTNKAALEKVSFIKGTCMNYNKDLDDFAYF